MKSDTERCRGDHVADASVVGSALSNRSERVGVTCDTVMIRCVGGLDEFDFSLAFDLANFGKGDLSRRGTSASGLAPEVVSSATTIVATVGHLN